MNPTITDPKSILSKYFGFSTFRPFQEEIIKHIIDGKDCLTIMPTGGGKSICFQIPALIFDGLTIVVSPLIALMKDQVQNLIANGIPAGYLNSSLTPHQQDLVIQYLFEKKLKLLYVSPERLLSESFQATLKQLSLSFIAIDEAHCISTWGHDFREEYTRLGELKRIFPHIPIAAFTATADSVTQRDIIKQLKLVEPRSFVASFDRPNLKLNVYPAQNRFEFIQQFVEEHPGESGIIYCLSRKGTESLAGKLVSSGIIAGYYHAGMTSHERNKVQDAFIKDQVKIICATIAFGMGIDKSNIRWVIHYNLPKNIEGYYQEIGRCGRDGLPAETILFYSYGDVFKLKSFIEDSPIKEVQEEKLKRIVNYAETKTCRRRTLLNYFNDRYTKNCGNCDICIHPPKYFDGTQIAQKAISAIIRMKEKVAIGTLIDHLRGAKKAYLLKKRLDQVKTYGVGADLSYETWQNFIMQLIHMGYLDIAYEEYKWLKVTETGKQFIYNKENVELAEYEDYKISESRRTPRVKKKTKTQIKYEDMLDILKSSRQDWADQEGVPPHVVFSDVTLDELAKTRPAYPNPLAEITGMSKSKLEKYGDQLLDLIREFKLSRNDVGSTYIETLYLVHQGHTIQEISNIRERSLGAIVNHLIRLRNEGAAVQLEHFIPEADLQKVKQAVKAMPDAGSTNDFYEYMRGQVVYWKITLAMAILGVEISSD